MSAGQESTGDLVAVACVVEASLLLASEWSRILIEYIQPLLKRLNELHPAHQFRIAFVTYGAADTRPSPLISRKYFAPLPLVLKELREEPSKLGIGQTNSGSGRGLSALEGLVAAIELFDILMASANFNINHSQTQPSQKDNRSLLSHLLHIAASPPDNAQRPQCNTLQHLDSVNWESIPTELRKRKINLSLISLRKISQFQNLQSSVAGSGTQSPWFKVHAPHILLLAGFPTPQKTGTKRPTDAPPGEQSPDAKRQKVVVDPVSKTSSASPALPPARIPQNERSQQSVSSSQVTQPPSTTASGQNSISAEPVQATPSVPASTPATASPSAPLPPSGPSVSEVYEQVIPSIGHKFGQMVEAFKKLESDISTLNLQIADAQNNGQTLILAALQKERARKEYVREQLKTLLRQYYHNIRLADSLGAQVGTAEPALPMGPAEAGPSTQHHPPDVSSASSERPVGATTDEHKPAIPDSQILTQFWQSRGGTISASSGSTPQAGPSQTQPHPTMTPEVAAQAQKPNERKTVVQSPNTSVWFGTLSGAFPKLSGQVTNEVQVHVVGIFTASPLVGIRTEIRTEMWPRNLTLNSCKEPVSDPTELSSWLRRHQPLVRLMRFISNPRVPDAPLNEQRFQTLIKSMDEHHTYAYTGWQQPSGRFSYNIFIFSMRSNFLAGAVFPDGIPDLPGSGNVLEAQPSVEQPMTQLLNGITVPPMLSARMRGLEPAKQKQKPALFIQQEQLRRQQAQQTQQSHTSPGQALNPLGMSIPPNAYSAVAGIPTGLHANANLPTNVGAYNTGSVNYEMLQSFMQRSAEESSLHGMNVGGMNPS